MLTTKLGMAITAITPPFPVPLAGYAARRGEFAGVCRSLSLRVWLFVQESEGGAVQKALLVQGDLIWWAPERMVLMRSKLQEGWGIPAAHVIFHASHTHGGPQTSERFHRLVGLARPEYVAYLEQQVDDAVAEAHRNIEPIRMEQGTGLCEGIGINRRKRENETIVMAPNPDGTNDTEVTVIRCATLTGETKGVLFHFTCHPTTTADNDINAEFCGAAMEMLDERLGKGKSCYLQGCCGDIRASLSRDGRFYSGHDSDVQQFGERLAGVVNDILQQPLTPMRPAGIAGWSIQVELPFEQVPAAAELVVREGDSETVQEWKELLLSNPDKLRPVAPLQLQLLQVAEGLAFLAIDGEVVVEYGLLIKRLSQHRVLPLAYSNGMVGYIPTAQQIRDGGYEGCDSFVIFGYPSPFAETIEPLIHTAIDTLLAHMKSPQNGAEEQKII
ncbi:MAG: hypothetical protein J7639_17400 [Paenibacillaceae bacterium]|nr:hypothetical protein [Paenibacillaceae bacterium]